MPEMSLLARLVSSQLDQTRAESVMSTLEIDPELLAQGAPVSRAVFAMAMNVVLFAGLLERVPTGAAYVADRQAAGERLVFDHGALRTINFGQGPTGALPAGETAFSRFLEPLGYAMAAVYPLDRLKMTGRAYRHLDRPETIPQFFISELHVDRFSPEFAAAAHRVFDSTGDPLGEAAWRALDGFRRDGCVEWTAAVEALSQVVAAFGRQHQAPRLPDYETLLAESKEAAWIATEGCAFNHATDRVADVAATAEAQRRLGRAVKDEVEVSRSGRVRQTAFKADPVQRTFRDGTVLTTPGSFYEFISRDRLEDGTLDLAFDSANAQGIFKMTAAAG